MFISDEAFAQLHQELMLEHKAKLRMITDNNKLYRILQEIKAIAENAYCLTNYTNKDMADFAKQILIKLTKAEEE